MFGSKFTKCIVEYYDLGPFCKPFYRKGLLRIHSIKLSFQYLKLVRQMDGYGEVTFPHCACDSRKDGHVIAIVGIRCFKLQACKEDGTPEVSNY